MRCLACGLSSYLLNSSKHFGRLRLAILVGASRSGDCGLTLDNPSYGLRALPCIVKIMEGAARRGK